VPTQSSQGQQTHPLHEQQGHYPNKFAKRKRPEPSFELAHQLQSEWSQVNHPLVRLEKPRSSAGHSGPAELAHKHRTMIELQKISSTTTPNSHLGSKQDAAQVRSSAASFYLDPRDLIAELKKIRLTKSHKFLLALREENSFKDMVEVVLNEQQKPYCVKEPKVRTMLVAIKKLKSVTARQLMALLYLYAGCAPGETAAKKLLSDNLPERFPPSLEHLRAVLLEIWNYVGDKPTEKALKDWIIEKYTT